MNVKNKFKPNPNIRLMDQVRAVIRDGFTSEQIETGMMSPEFLKNFPIDIYA